MSTKQATASVDTNAAPRWGRAIGAQMAADTRSEIAKHDAAERARLQFKALVASEVPSWLERMADAMEAAIDELNFALHRPFVRVVREGAGHVHLRASGRAQDARGFLDCAPEKPPPGLRVAETRHGREQVVYYPFVPDGGASGLLLMVSGRALGPDDAARALVEPWLSALDIRVQELAWHEQIERLAIALPSRLTDVTNVAIAELSATSTAAEFAAIVDIDCAAFQPETWTPGMFRAAIHEGGRVFMSATPKAGVTGFCLMGRLADGALPIVRLAVLPDERRKRIGRALLQHALTEGARLGGTRAVLDINRANDAVRRFYIRAGFSVVTS